MSEPGGERRKLTDLALKLNRLETEKYSTLYATKLTHIPPELSLQLAQNFSSSTKPQKK